MSDSADCGSTMTASTARWSREEPVVAALPATHRLARRKRLPLAELVGEPLLLYPAKPRPSYADQVLDMFRSRGLRQR